MEESSNIISRLKTLREKNEDYLRLINVLLEENKKLRNDLTNYELIKVIMNDDGTKPLIRPREEELEVKKFCFLCKRNDLDLSELPWQTKEKHYACDSCREEIEEDNRKVQESRLRAGKPKETRKIGGRKARVSNEEALKHARPSKNKGKSICLECKKEFLTQYFHAHYAIHV